MGVSDVDRRRLRQHVMASFVYFVSAGLVASAGSGKARLVDC